MCLPECPILPSSIPHGFIQSGGLHKGLGFFKGKGYLEGSQYQFSCEKGYSLVGAETLACTDSGIWNDSLPSCLRGTCIFNQSVQPSYDRVRLLSTEVCLPLLDLASSLVIVKDYDPVS